MVQKFKEGEMKIIANEKICVLVNFYNPFITNSIIGWRLSGKIKAIRFMGVRVFIGPGCKKRPEVVVEHGWLKSKEGK